MKAVVWHGKRDVRVDRVPDPKIEEPTDAIVRITSTAICGSDLHLYTQFAMAMKRGDILGHEPMGIVEEVGPAVTNLKQGDRVVIPFNISCGHCFYCKVGMQSQCETTQNPKSETGASLFGYTHLYGGVAGGQAELLRVPQAQYGPIKLPHGPPDVRFLYLSDVLPTAWQAVVYADVPRDGTLAIYGLGPIGQMSARVALHRGAKRVIGIDQVPERLALARRYGVETIDFSKTDDVVASVHELTDGRGPESVIDAVGMEAEGTVLDTVLQKTMLQFDRLTAFRNALNTVRRGGTVSVSGVYAGRIQMYPLGDLFDRQITVRVGQANVHRWTDEILPLLLDGDPLHVEDFASHIVPLEEAPRAYAMFQKKEDGAIKIVLRP